MTLMKWRGWSGNRGGEEKESRKRGIWIFRGNFSNLTIFIHFHPTSPPSLLPKYFPAAEFQLFLFFFLPLFVGSFICQFFVCHFFFFVSLSRSSISVTLIICLSFFVIFLFLFFSSIFFIFPFVDACFQVSISGARLLSIVFRFCVLDVRVFLRIASSYHLFFFSAFVFAASVQFLNILIFNEFTWLLNNFFRPISDKFRQKNANFFFF